MYKTHFKGLVALICTLTMIISGLIQAPVTAKASGFDYYEPYNGQIIMFENGYSGWAMNTMQGSGNGTAIDVYRYDGTTDEKYRVVSKGNGVFWLESVRVPGKYVDQRSDGSICIWNDDGTTTKNLRMRVFGNKVALVFDSGLCIAPASAAKASAQEKLYRRTLNTANAEMLWTLRDGNWNVISLGNSVSENSSIERDALAQQRIRELYSKLTSGEAYSKDAVTAGGKIITVNNQYYFTTDRLPEDPNKQIRKHIETNTTNSALLSSIIAQSWFTDIFGTGINTSLFPELYIANGADYQYDNNGYQCFGFAVFASWYIGSNGDTSKPVEVTTVKKTTFANLKNEDIHPGDILRANYIDSEDGTNFYHSMIVYSVENTGIKVLHCNYDSSRRGKCAIIFDEYSTEFPYCIKYNDSCLGGNHTIYVERIKDIY